jgi:hypothetical protein
MFKSVQSHSSNIYQPQSGQSVFLSQAHPQIAQNQPAIALESAAASARGGARLGAHNAARGVENAPPQRTPNGRIGESLAQRRLWHESKYPQQFAASGAISTHQGQLPSDSNPALREQGDALHQQSNILNTTEPGSEAKRPHGGVRQDKARLASARIASPQPAPVTKVTRALFTNTHRVRSQSVPGARERRQRVTLWVDPRVKTHLARLAEQEGLTVSTSGATLLERALQQNADLQYGALLTPIIEQAIARQMRGIATRLAWLLVRVAFDAGQTRSLVTNILGRQPGMNQDLLRTILAESGKTAKANITRRTPQITQMIESVEQWIKDKENDGGEKNS